MLRSIRILSVLFAISALHQSSSLTQQVPQWQKLAEQADSLQRERQYAEAALYWEKAANQVIGNASDSVTQLLKFKQLYAKAVSYEYEKEGIPFFEEAYPLLPYAKLNASEQSTFLNTYYHFLGYNNRWEEALPLALECVELRNALHEDPPLAYLSAVHDVAYIQNKIGNYPEAIAYYHQSIDGYIQHHGEQDSEVALGYNNLAFNYGLAGMANKSYTYYLKASRIWSNIELADNSYLMTAYGNQLRWQQQYGDHIAMEGILANIRELVDHKNKAWGSKNRLIANKNDHEHPTLLLSYWKSCLDYHQLKKDVKGIQNYLDSTSRFIQNLPKKPGDEVLEYLNNAHSVLGDVYAVLGNHEKAASCFRTAFAQMAKYTYGGRLEHNHARLAKSLMEMGQFGAASSHMAQAFNTARPGDLPVFHALSAQLAAKMGQSDSVRFHVDRSLATLSQNEALNGNLTQLTSSSFHGRVTRQYISSLSANGHHLLRLYRGSQRAKDLHDANHLFTLALGMLNVYYLGGPYTDALADMQTAIHYGLLECRLSLQEQNEEGPDLAALFENLENNRSQLRWKKFIKNTPSNSTNLPDTLREAEDEQRQLLVFYKQQLAKSLEDREPDSQSNQWRAKIHACENTLVGLEEQLLAFNDRYISMSQGMVTTVALQKTLPKQTSMLRYMLTDSAAYVMRIDRSSLTLFQLGSTDSIEALVHQATTQLRARSAEYYTTATKLHHLLIAPEISRGLHHNLIIVPDGILHQLPFEALTKTAHPSSFLLYNHHVSYASSTALWLAQQGIRHNGDHAFGAFAPDYPGITASERANEPTKLIGAANEASMITQLFGGDIYQQNTFGKQDFLNRAPNYSLLHLAMHANVQATDGEHANFHFGDGSKLYAYELYGMRLQANMAVLSACNTGFGGIQKGEGVQSLSTAFTYAGVPSLVMGLWSLPDASTSGIMINFYQQLLENKPKHAALASAKANYLTQVKHELGLQHPFYWAGLVLTGDTTPITGQPVFWPYWFWLSVMVLILISGLIFRYRKRPIRR